MRSRTDNTSVPDLVSDIFIQVSLEYTTLFIRLIFLHLLTFFYDGLLFRWSLEVIFQAWAKSFDVILSGGLTDRVALPRGYLHEEPRLFLRKKLIPREEGHHFGWRTMEQGQRGRVSLSAAQCLSLRLLSSPPPRPMPESQCEGLP